jgi:hypothetical protein
VAVGRAARTVWTGATRGRGPGIVTVRVEWIAMLVVMRVLRVRPGSSYHRQQYTMPGKIYRENCSKAYGTFRKAGGSGFVCFLDLLDPDPDRNLFVPVGANIL